MAAPKNIERNEGKETKAKERTYVYILVSPPNKACPRSLQKTQPRWCEPLVPQKVSRRRIARSCFGSPDVVAEPSSALPSTVYLCYDGPVQQGFCYKEMTKI